MKNDTERAAFFLGLIAIMAVGILALEVTLYFFTVNN